MGTSRQQRRRAERDRERAAGRAQSDHAQSVARQASTDATAAQRADLLLKAAVYAPPKRPDLVEDNVREALTITSGGRRLAPELLQVHLNGRLRTLYGAGWQPLDVVHVVGRLGQAHRALIAEAIALEHLSAGEPELDPRWAAQLERIASSIRHRTLPFEGSLFRDRPDLSFEELLGLTDRMIVGVDALAVLMQLRVLPEEMPPPGRPGASRRVERQPGTRLDEKVLARVRGLLTKAESTTFEAEAEALTSKAQELMARHAIDLAMLDASGPRHDAPSSRRIHLDDPYADPKSLLLSVVAKENHCRAVFMAQPSLSTVFGFEADLDIVELLFTSLLAQATTAMLAHGKDADRAGRSRTRSFRQTFLVSFAQRISERLHEARLTAEAEARDELGDGFLPVLASRHEEVEASLRGMFPNLVSKNVSVTNAAGWEAGRDAADRASLKVADQIARRGKAG